MRGASRHHPGIPGLQPEQLLFDVQLGSAGKHVAYRLVVAPGNRLGLAGLLILPEPHPQAAAGGQAFLPLRTARRTRRIDLAD
ncbi:hypothetical protein D3C72_1983630 [compost metagenome]